MDPTDQTMRQSSFPFELWFWNWLSPTGESQISFKSLPHSPIWKKIVKQLLHNIFFAIIVLQYARMLILDF